MSALLVRKVMRPKKATGRKVDSSLELVERCETTRERADQLLLFRPVMLLMRRHLNRKMGKLVREAALMPGPPL
jgi:hypothetical protein